ncbi:MAG: transposase [Phycisphaerales bacterium]|nr:MAG: transposase [Phycisphaerales bacterium]
MREGDRYSKRCRRWNTAGHAHALTFSCYRQRGLLLEGRFCRYLVGAIDAARSAHAFDLWAYVFMPEHVHLVLYPTRDEYSIARILQSIKQPVARKAMAFLTEHRPDDLQRLATGQQRRARQFWQKGGGYDRNITKVKTLIETVRYIHNNPVRRGLVQTATQWRYSSAGAWEGTGAGPIAIDRDSFPVF